MTTIYTVTEHDHMMRFYWYATKREAEKHRREWKPSSDDDTCEIDTVEFPISKAGVVAALNYVVGLTCLNEG